MDKIKLIKVIFNQYLSRVAYADKIWIKGMIYIKSIILSVKSFSYNFFYIQNLHILEWCTVVGVREEHKYWSEEHV